MPARFDDLSDIRTISFRASGADVSPDGKRFIGYPIVFNSLSEDLTGMGPGNGAWKEVIAPEAVDRTLRDGFNVQALLNHDDDKLLADVSTGRLVLRKDRHGLKSEIVPTDTTYARDAIVNVKEGLIGGMSFRFRLQRDRATGEVSGVTWSDDPVDGYYIRTIHDMTFSEVSIVTSPAYQATEVQVRKQAIEAFRRHMAERTWKPSIALRDRIVRAGLR